MSVCLLVIDDGREDYLHRCMASIGQQFPFDAFSHQILIDDTAHELGFAGAVQEGWRQVLETGCEYVWHAESDFTYNEPVDVERMIHVLEAAPYLTQMSLLRQSWNEEEHLAGGIIPANPDQFTQKSWKSCEWVETDRFFFTTNPSIYSTDLCRRGFPDPPEAEGRFGAAIAAENPHARAGIWGKLDDPPRVLHIGETRTGGGY